MNILILSDSDSGYQKIAKAVCRDKPAAVFRASSFIEAENMLAKVLFNAVIVFLDTDIKALFSLRSASLKCGADIILIENGSKHTQSVLCETEEMGIITIEQSDADTALHYVIKILALSQKKISGLQSKNHVLMKKIDDIKLVNRAKLLLMQNLGYTEKQAHKHMETQAMNLKITLRGVAMNILKTYEM